MRTIFNLRWGSCKIKLNMSLIYALKRSNLAAYIDVFVSLKTPEVALNIRANKWISDLLLPQYIFKMKFNYLWWLMVGGGWASLLAVSAFDVNSSPLATSIQKSKPPLNKLPITIFGLLSVPVNHKNCISELFPSPCLSNLNRRQNIR